MKFICNNCNFSAKVPKRISNCPMCGSDNTSIYEDEEQILSQPKIEPVPEEPIVKQEEISSFKSEPEKEEPAEEEFILEKKEEKQSSSKAPVIVIAVIVTLAAAFAVFHFKGKSDSPTAIQDENKAIETEAKPEQQEPEEVKATPATADIEEKVAEETDKNQEIAKDDINTPDVLKTETVKNEVKKEDSAKEALTAKTEKKATQPEKEKPQQIKTAEKASIKLKGNLKPLNIKNDIKLKMPSASEYIEKGNQAISSGNYAAARDFFKKAVQRDKKAAKAYRGLGISYSQLNQPSAACANYRKYLQYDPNTPEKAQLEQMLAEYCR